MVVVLIIPIPLCQVPIIFHFITLQKRLPRQRVNTYLCIASLLPSVSIDCTDKRKEQHEGKGGCDVENYQVFPVRLTCTHPTVSRN